MRVGKVNEFFERTFFNGKRMNSLFFAFPEERHSEESFLPRELTLLQLTPLMEEDEEADEVS